MDAVKKHTWWLIGASIAYLVLELVFNASLLDVVADPGASRFDARGVELFGRAVSGIGFALLVTAFVLRRGWRGWLFWFALAWAVMFFGQRWLIDKFLIEPSDWKTRQKAQYVSYLKSALGYGIVEIENLPLLKGKPERAEEKTMLALLGGLAMEESEFLDELRRHTDEIVKRVILEQSTTRFEEHYQRYQGVARKIAGAWDKYRESSARYDKAIVTRHAKAADIWAETYAKMRKSGWREYQDAVDRAHRKAGAAERKAHLAELAHWYFKEDHCRSRFCRKSRESAFRFKTKSRTGKVIPPRYFCYKRKRGGVIGLLNALTGDPVYDGPLSSYSCPGDRESAIRALLLAFNDEFKKKSGGYHAFLDSPDEFMAHPATAKAIVRRSAAKGIKLPPDWTMADHAVFRKAVAEQIVRKAKARWNAESRRLLGQSMPAKLSYGQFIHHPVVQAYLKDQLGDYYVKGLSPDWNRKQFKAKVVVPLSQRLVRQAANALEKQAESLGEGRRNAVYGRDYLRAAIVPPIALALSLFFGLLTFAKVIFSLVSTTYKAREDQPLPVPVRLAVLGTLGLLIVGLPFVASNRYTENKAVARLVDTAKASSSPWKGWFADYTLRVEPVIYPAGNAVLRLWSSEDESATSEDG